MSQEIAGLFKPIPEEKEISSYSQTCLDWHRGREWIYIFNEKSRERKTLKELIAADGSSMKSDNDDQAYSEEELNFLLNEITTEKRLQKLMVHFLNQEAKHGLFEIVRSYIKKIMMEKKYIFFSSGTENSNTFEIKSRDSKCLVFVNKYEVKANSIGKVEGIEVDEVPCFGADNTENILKVSSFIYIWIKSEGLKTKLVVNITKGDVEGFIFNERGEEEKLKKKFEGRLKKVEQWWREENPSGGKQEKTLKPYSL